MNASGSFILEQIKKMASETPGKAAFVEHKTDTEKVYTYRQYEHDSDVLAARLLAEGITRGDIVASYTLNGYELNVLDLALQKAGAVHAIFFPNYGVPELKDALLYCRPKRLVSAAGFFLTNALGALHETEETIPLVCFQANTKGVPCLFDTGTVSPPSLEITVSGNDFYSLYFTSGTTGSMKGALVTHSAISETIREMQRVFPLQTDSTAISMAPLAVSSERCLNYYYQCSGITVHYPGNMENLLQTIASAKPGMFLTSPLFLEKVKKGLFEKSHGLPPSLKTRIFRAALDFALRNTRIRPHARPGSLLHRLYDRTVYRRIRHFLGGRIRYIMSGGAASNKDTLRFFWNIGIPVYEGYGMTECHIISVNPPGAEKNTFSHAGKPFGRTEIKISEQGEIWCRSPYLFTRYLHPDGSAQNCFSADGYFKTGDRGTLDSEGNLSISGRIKNIFKTLSGIYINPEALENRLSQDPAIEQVMVIGENRPYLSALLYAGTAGRAEAEKAVARYNAGKVEAEQIKKTAYLEAALTVEKGELTANQKLKREVVAQNHATLIAGLYEH